MNMKKLLLFLTLTCCGVSAFAQKSGIVFRANDAQLGEYKQISLFSYPPDFTDPTIAETKWLPTLGFDLGYQFCFRLTEKFSVDAAAILGIKQGNLNSYTATLLPDETYEISNWSKNSMIWSTSISGAVNYNFWKGVYAGVGVEPIVYINTGKFPDNKKKSVFDCPIVVSAGYEFLNQMKLSAYYKHGFNSIYTIKNSANVRDNQELGLSLFIPICK